MKRMMLKKIIIGVLFLISLSVSLLINGCAANANRMVPTDFEVVNKHHHTVSINISTGWKETNFLWTSQVSNSAFTEALNNALVKSGVFQAVIKGGGADYLLDVTILNYDQPWIGINFDIRMKTKWKLTDTKTLVPVWSGIFETTYRAKFSDALIAAERLQKANEGSVRTNIKEGIRRLSLLSL
ncbi:MAG: hypothetical protein KAS96_06280 [Planctomycetes bacterium]|nr:hypothetical protein [Planctomycetota bacterium]